MKEKKFLEELKAKGFDSSKPTCAVHYGNDLCSRLVKLALVKDYKVTTVNMTYWIRFSDSLDEHIFGMEIEGFVGPDTTEIASAFAEVLNSLNLKEIPKQKISSTRRKASIKCGKGWLRISALGGREKNIRLDFIKQVKFEKYKILIQVIGEWTTIRAYNHQTIEEYIEKRKRSCEDYWDYYEDKAKQAENFAEAINLEREWIEALGQDIPLPKGKEIGWWFTPGTDDYYLQDEDFSKLSNRLNQLIDNCAIEEEVE